jgi:ribosomal protein S20
MGPNLFHNEKLLNLLNLDADSLKTEIKDGKSLLTIAEEHGVSEQSLKETLQNEMTQRIDQGVKEGRLSEDKAQQIKGNMANHIDDMIHGKIPMKNHPHNPQPEQ